MKLVFPRMTHQAMSACFLFLSIYESEAKCKTFHMKISFVCIWMKTYFHDKNFALSLAFIMRFKATRKWSISNMKRLKNFFFSQRIYIYSVLFLFSLLFPFSGSNQRMEFLGDSVLQFVVSVYLYKHFPEHHEGHLTVGTHDPITFPSCLQHLIYSEPGQVQSF